MAATGATPISLYYSSTSTNVPTAGNLVAGELAINTADGKLFYKDSAGVVQVIGTKGGVGSSTTTQVLYNSSGLVVGSANMTFSGTALTLANDASISGLTVGKGGGAVSTNTVVGASAGQANTTGSNCTAIGNLALYSNTNTGNNTAVGYNSMYLNNGGFNNTAVGVNSLQTNSTGVSNAAFSNSALNGNTTGSYNTGIGNQALYSNTTASNNTAVGYQALYTNTTAPQSTAIGYQALYNSTGGYNTAVGYAAAAGKTTGDSCTFIGRNTAGATHTGGSCVFVGDTSGSAATSGSNNTFIGTNSGSAVTTGAKNTILGNYSGNQGSLDIRTSSNYIVLSDGDGHPFIYGQYGATSYVSNYFMASGAGTHYMKWNSSTYAWTIDTSSRLIKENIIDSPYGLQEILQLQPRKYFRTDDQKEEIGFIADEVASVIPEIVPTIKKSFFTKKEEDVELIPSGVDYARLTPILVKAIQELKTEFDAYKATHP